MSMPCSSHSHDQHVVISTLGSVSYVRHAVMSYHTSFEICHVNKTTARADIHDTHVMTSHLCYSHVLQSCYNIPSLVQKPLLKWPGQLMVVASDIYIPQHILLRFAKETLRMQKLIRPKRANKAQKWLRAGLNHLTSIEFRLPCFWATLREKKNICPFSRYLGIYDVTNLKQVVELPLLTLVILWPWHNDSVNMHEAAPEN